MREKADKNTPKYAWNENFWDITPFEGDAIGIKLVKIIEYDSPLVQMLDFIAAKNKEVEGMKMRKVWKKMDSSSVPENANIVGGRFVLTLKNFSTPEETAKVRYFAQGYKNSLKNMLAHAVASFRSLSIRLILSNAATLNLRLFLHDVTQVYL